MRLASGILAGFAIAAALAAASPAAAWDRDIVYADSFGNLVIESAAGYKRIVVGRGEDAARLQQFSQADAPETFYEESESVVVVGECYRPPVLVKGRSYMYGFDQGEIPLQGGRCR
jgi:hypothetical protein